jgi:xanthine phosphoribosyltransferase
MTHYNFDQFTNDIPRLAALCESFEPDTIIAIARGGMMLSHALCMNLNVRNLQSIRCESYNDSKERSSLTIFDTSDLKNSNRILIVDDIVDSGQTLHALIPFFTQKYPDKEFKSATLFTKSTALIQSDFSLYEATDWIEFFWESNFLKHNSL